MKAQRIVKSALITLALPAGMFFLMMIITRLFGVTYYGNRGMWRTIFTKLMYTMPMAYGISMQLRNGRMDFSGGATMVLSAIVGSYIAQRVFDGNPIMMLFCCIAVAVAVSMVTAGAYIAMRLPIIICTIAMALLYESLTLVVCGGQGIDILSNEQMTQFGRFPYGILMLLGSITLYHVVITYTTVGRRGVLLRNGQTMAVNIGVNEKKNVVCLFIFSGVLLGMGAVVYASQNKVATQSNLSTASILFANIASVYIGRFIGKASTEAIGILMGALSVQLMNYGLSAIGYGSGGWDNIMFGIFMMSFYTFISINERMRTGKALSL